MFQFDSAQSRILGKCKFCIQFSFIEDMIIDEVDNKPYHQKCKDEITASCESCTEANSETTKAGESQQ